MARKNTLIHLHGSSRLNDASILNKGEIAVTHAASKVETELAVKTTVEGTDTLVYIPSIDRVTADIATVAANTLKDAKEYADGKASAAQTAAEGYADDIKNDLQGQIDDIAGEEGALASAVEEVKGYADDAAANALKDAKAYTDEEIGKVNDVIEENEKVTSEAFIDLNGRVETLEAQDVYVKSTVDQQIADAQAAAAEDAKNKADAALASAKTYADGLAKNYDAAGSAATAESNAKAYADSLATNYDAAGSAATAESNAKKYTDEKITAEVSRADAAYDTKGAAAAAEAAAKSHADGKASAAQAAAEATAAANLKLHAEDTELHVTKAKQEAWDKVVADFNDFLTGTDTDDVINKLSDIKAWMDESGEEATNLSTAIANEAKARGEADTALSERIDALTGTGTTSVAGQIATAKQEAIVAANEYTDDAIEALDTTAQGYATTAAAGALKDAKEYADGLATNYDAAGSAAKALTDAQDYADSLATNYDAAGSAAKALTDAQDYADGLAKNYDAAGAAATAESNAKAYADEKITAEVSRADAAYDTKGAAATAESNAKKYTDEKITAEVSRADAAYDTKGAAAAAEAAAKSHADGKASAAESNAKTYADNELKNYLKTVTVTNSGTGEGKNGVAVTTGENTVNLDFTNMIIDCGEY